MVHGQWSIRGNNSYIFFMRVLTLLTLFAYFVSPLGAQEYLLYSEDFESGNLIFNMNDDGPGINSGSNSWIINDIYAGESIFPDNTTQDITNGGDIAFAPTSNYLHIHDASSGIENGNFSPDFASDNFASTFSVCTHGMENIHLSFFFLCEGSENAFGTIYYKKNEGDWIQFGSATYAGFAAWQYVDISDSEFNDAQIQFGFRWQNTNESATPNQPFCIDDIKVVGSSSLTNPTTMSLDVPASVCSGSYIVLNYLLSDTLCNGNYQIQLSNANGSFIGTTNSWIYSIQYPQTAGTINILLPFDLPSGLCYKFRITRLTSPEIPWVESNCMELVSCPNVITTLQPSVTLDTNAVCYQSAIDIPFWSTGTYNSFNEYNIQISDEFGVFAEDSNFDNIVTTAAFDPSLGSLPGILETNVPSVIPGCNYYLRIVSTDPPIIGSAWGPFCIQICDIKSNTYDLSQCINACDIDPDGELNLIVHHDFYADAEYLAGNIFTTQVFNTTTFEQIGEDGILGTDDGTGAFNEIEFIIPCIENLDELGLSAGKYYFRVIATNSSQPENTLGTLKRLTIGEFHDDHLIQSYDYPFGNEQDTFCLGETTMLLFTPYSYLDHSTFLWSSSLISNGMPFTSPSGSNSSSLFVNQNVSGPATFSIQETNYGCVSDWSEEFSLMVIEPPQAEIIGPSNVCPGDTIHFFSNFNNSTYYGWQTNALSNQIAFQDTSANELNILFNTAGEFEVELIVVNQCGADQTLTSVLVSDIDATIIEGDASLAATTSFGNIQWVDCNNNFAPLFGETNQYFTPSTNGDYAVIVSNGICTDTSECVNISYFGIDEYSKISVVYPNPSSGIVNVQTFSTSRVQITDALGQIVYSGNLKSGIETLDISDCTSGIYVLKLTDGHSCTTYKLMIE